MGGGVGGVGGVDEGGWGWGSFFFPEDKHLMLFSGRS